MRKIIPVARRVLRENDDLIVKMRKIYGEALYHDDSATLDNLREAVTTLEDVGRTAQRVFGGVHPIVVDIMERSLRDARAKLRARETPPRSA